MACKILYDLNLRKSMGLIKDLVYIIRLFVTYELTDDPTVQQKVLSGEWDFYDVADYHRPMAPMRSPNGANTGAFNVSNMSDEQFDRLLANLAAGKKYDAR